MLLCPAAVTSGAFCHPAQYITFQNHMADCKVFLVRSKIHVIEGSQLLIIYAYPVLQRFTASRCSDEYNEIHQTFTGRQTSQNRHDRQQIPVASGSHIPHNIQPDTDTEEKQCPGCCNPSVICDIPIGTFGNDHIFHVNKTPCCFYVKYCNKFCILWVTKYNNFTGRPHTETDLPLLQSATAFATTLSVFIMVSFLRQLKCEMSP